MYKMANLKAGRHSNENEKTQNYKKNDRTEQNMMVDHPKPLIQL